MLCGDLTGNRIYITDIYTYIYTYIYIYIYIYIYKTDSLCYTAETNIL